MTYARKLAKEVIHAYNSADAPVGRVGSPWTEEMARWYEVRLDAAEAAITRAMAHVQERCAKAAETCAFGADIPRRIRALPPEEVT